MIARVSEVSASQCPLQPQAWTLAPVGGWLLANASRAQRAELGGRVRDRWRGWAPLDLSDRAGAAPHESGAHESERAQWLSAPYLGELGVDSDR